MNVDAAIAALTPIVTVFEQLDIAYYIGGMIFSVYSKYGEKRLTENIYGAGPPVCKLLTCSTARYKRLD